MLTPCFTHSQADDIKEYTIGLHLLCVSSTKEDCLHFVNRYGSFFKLISMASSATEGLAIFAENCPDIMVVSHPLDNFSVFDFLKRLPEYPSRTPVIIHTDSVDLEFVTKTLNLGVLRFIPRSSTEEDTLLAIGDLARQIFAKRAYSILVNQDQALQDILAQVNDVAMQINQVATAAEEQTATTSEISSNMMQITEVVQQTSHGAHESATAAAQLNSNAEELQRLVRQFKL